ncbi:hypothetical protein TWF696_008456 [Orbilia brochopaga]|uniref:Uncharacterized protein n=1 Tax=Orbilia brochopaga TaxID=3140254 RepID=A0AAV9UFR8_9PEZI
MVCMSTLRTPHHFRSLTFSSTHTYMNSPSNRITLASGENNDEDVPCLDLNFPESAGKNGNYFRRVMKFRIPINRTTFYWNGNPLQPNDIVVKVDPSYVQYLVKGDEGEFVAVSHPDHPDASQSFIARSFLKDDTFVDEGVFVLGECTRPSEIRKVLTEAKAHGATVVAVGLGGVDNLYALHAVCAVGLDPCKYFDYWYEVACRARSREREGMAKVSFGQAVDQSGAFEFEIAPRAAELSALPQKKEEEKKVAVVPAPVVPAPAVPAAGVAAKKAAGKIVYPPAVPAFGPEEAKKIAGQPRPRSLSPASRRASPRPSPPPRSLSPSSASSDKENVGSAANKQLPAPAATAIITKPASPRAPAARSSPSLKGILKSPSDSGSESDGSSGSKKSVTWAREATAYLEREVRRGVGRGCTRIVEAREEIRVREDPTAGRLLSRSELEELERAERAISRSKRRRLRAKERKARALAAAAAASSPPASSSPSSPPPPPAAVRLVPAAVPRPPSGRKTWAQVAKGPVGGARRPSPSVAAAAAGRAPAASAPSPAALSVGSSSPSGVVRGTRSSAASGSPASPLREGGSGSLGLQFPAVNDGPEDLGTCQGRTDYMVRKIGELTSQARKEEA